MKPFITLTISIAGTILLGAFDATAADRSQGRYRLPYRTGTEVKVTRDHLTHTPETRIDMRGVNGSDPYAIVAAADGVIRYIVDTNTVTCTEDGCGKFNNYVWIEHPNGEWTKYSHMQTGTTTGKAGLSVGNRVCAGAYLGDEDDVGFASGKHLHFEVAIPDDPGDPIQTEGGYVKGDNLIPRFCGVPDSTVVAGDTYTAEPCAEILLSAGVYRIPYQDGTKVRVSGDHVNHAVTPTRIDMSGQDGRAYTIVAAADGIIRYIVETNTITCTTNGCSQFNNYMWIEHPNGEWTKYSHMQTGSSTAMGRYVGEPVCSGTPLGIEGAIGAAGGLHLHWEVGVPNDLADPIRTSGGFLKGSNRIPVICGIAGNLFAAGDTYTAAPCDPEDCLPDIFLPAQTLHGAKVYMAGNQIDSDNKTVTVASCGILSLRAGNKITLRTGFRARFNSWLHAEIKDCNEMQRLPNCLPIGTASSSASRGDSGSDDPLLAGAMDLTD